MTVFNKLNFLSTNRNDFSVLSSIYTFWLVKMNLKNFKACFCLRCIFRILFCLQLVWADIFVC